MQSDHEWSDGIEFEVGFWDKFLAGDVDANVLKQRQAKTPLSWPAVEYIKYSSSDDKKLLDIGSGSLSAVGYLYEGKAVEVVGVDPLAEQYLALMKKHGIEPLHQLVGCKGEEISKNFPANHFDLVTVSNALDHTENPLKCMEESLAVLRPGCYFVAVHHRNEADAAEYTGFHQWNMDLRDSRAIIQGKKVTIDVERDLGDLIDDFKAWIQPEDDSFRFVFRKKSL